MKIIKIKKADVRYNTPSDVYRWLKKNEDKTWDNEKQFEKQFEKETDFEVLGVFSGYTNIIDPYGSDGEEYAIPVMRSGNKIVISL